MAVCLYEHNQTAYQSASAMLASVGKAAVIHPTGTGKSFIGFKLCEDHQDQKICWLSPSKYIFDTQLENLSEACGGYQPENVEFITYARLMNMPDAELSELQPGYIILDEFHRCGAAAWGQGVSRLLSMYADVPLLGLSATAIRYLDNQRDMSDELFDGHIASEMTLGEAIVRGILNPPIYVQSIYSYKEDMEKYSEKIRYIRNPKRREQAEDCLEQLRRTLDKAEGLDVLFDRHMINRHGKYIVFCAGYEAMQEAVGKTAQWFHLIDKTPKVYSLYAEDPSAVEIFRKFKEDQDNSHLRLLFCIDALNEGVHLEHISGVILLRPTVSPVVYKQQIGRALSASGRIRPVIFDVVNNIDSLYSIDAIKEEMDYALAFMKNSCSEDKIVNESFEILGELKDSLRLFDKLEGVLTASWDVMYLEAEKYYEAHGDLLPPMAYETDTGYALGRWVAAQRTNRRNNDPSMTVKRIELLDRIGMNWDSAEDRWWDTFYQAACAYYREYGNLDIPAEYETADGTKLGHMYRSIRKKYTNGTLSEEKRIRLEEIGIQWNSVLVRKWMSYYELAKAYYEEYGNLNIPHDYIAQGLKVGIWISVQRENYRAKRLSEQQIEMLRQIGMTWNQFDSRWEKGFRYAVRYTEEHGDINFVPESYKPEGFKLLAWIRTQRTRHKSGKLSTERSEQMEKLGLIWNPQDALWECGYAHAKAYVKEHGSLMVPPCYICEDGYKLKYWLNNQRTRFKTGRMTELQQKRLECIGMVFEKACLDS